MDVSVDDIANVFPRPLMDDEKRHAENLLAQALELIEMEFARRRIDLSHALVDSPWLQVAIKQAARIMVARAVLIGENVGQSAASSTTGPQSDSITFSQGIGIHWGGVGMDSEILDLLGLGASGMPRGRGGIVIPFGERVARSRLAEFAERRWR